MNLFLLDTWSLLHSYKMNKKFCLIVADRGSIKGNTDISGTLPPSQRLEEQVEQVIVKTRQKRLQKR